jgi:NAD(P)H-quinone oxidoreductase subunit I
MVTALREMAYLPKGELNPHGLPPGSRRSGQRPEKILEQIEQEAENEASK